MHSMAGYRAALPAIHIKDEQKHCLCSLTLLVAPSAEDVRRKQELAERKAKKEKRRQQKAAEAEAAAAALQASSSTAAAAPASSAPTGPIAFMFPGQGSQAVGMLKVTTSMLLLPRHVPRCAARHPWPCWHCSNAGEDQRCPAEMLPRTLCEGGRH